MIGRVHRRPDVKVGWKNKLFTGLDISSYSNYLLSGFGLLLNVLGQQNIGKLVVLIRRKEDNMAIKLKLELKWTKIKRVVTIPRGFNLMDLSDIIQAMFGFEHDHL